MGSNNPLKAPTDVIVAPGGDTRPRDAFADTHERVAEQPDSLNRGTSVGSVGVEAEAVDRGNRRSGSNSVTSDVFSVFEPATTTESCHHVRSQRQ